MDPSPPQASPPREGGWPDRRWRQLMRRSAPLAGLVAVAVAAYLTGVLHMLTPAALGREQASLREAFAAAPVASLLLYVAGYAVLTGACLPVAMVLSLTGGAIFGVWIASPAVLLGATGGALMTYAAARSAFAPLLRARAERDPRLQDLVQGFERNAFTYVLLLRFVPMAPFAMVNVAAGLAAAPLRAYALATLVGGVPTSLLYTSLGAGLGAALQSREALNRALYSPALLGPLAALTGLSLLPLLLRRRRRGQAER